MNPGPTIPPAASGAWANRHRGAGAVAWIALYLLLAAFPLLLLLLGPVPKGGGRWWDFSMALGFAGLAHFVIAPVSAHSLAMRATIVIEVLAAIVLLAVVAWTALCTGYVARRR